MIKGLSRAGIGDAGTVEQFVKLAAAHGFGAIDASAGELGAWADEVGLEQALATLREQGVQIGTMGLSVDWRTTDEAYRAGLAKLGAEAAIAAKFGVRACCTYVLPSTDLKAAHFMALATARLRTCARVLGAYGIRLGLEFVGPHHLRTRWANPFVWTLEETLDWIDAIGEPNVGLLFDAYHWYTTESDLDAIRALRPEQIVHVHLNDAKSVPVAEALDNDRVYPGEGVIDLAGFLRELHAIGYKGVVAQEILSQQPPQDSAQTLARRSADGFAKVYAAAGLE
ncbi:sugar phosphate isomerase/epimerase [Paenibacillus sp. IB182496]|uniref:Sugar phosphate isomerase/epimerase n=1 Tax=Paenibacillus sabuli TaxID=2772509 RepID=A0A927BV09_9BACL|nr:sugar phosphate isomerase/epimerase family protein [Paenibacillus sabuli]MBD2847348.1 sugar phosphate isomerase/epimerase [Paenibacillus sabuli]